MTATRLARLILTGLALTLANGCGSYSSSTRPHDVASVTVTLTASRIEVGESAAAMAEALDAYGDAVGGTTATFSSDRADIAGVSPTTGAIVAISPGVAVIRATIGSVTGRRSITVVGSVIRINEIESNGDAPGGWVELFNPALTPTDVSGYLLTGSDVFHGLLLPAGTSVPAQGYLVIDEANLPPGLNRADAVHLFSRFGVQVDAFTWDASPATSLGRCADGQGPIVPTLAATRSARNACPGA